MLLIALLFSLFQTPARAAVCLPVDQLREVQKAIKLPADFKESDLCNENTNSYKLLDTIIFLKTKKFPGANVPKEFNGNVLSENFWEFFSGEVDTLVNETGVGSCEGKIAYKLNDFNDYGHAINVGTITLCPNFYNSKKTLIERISVLMHEARHVKGYSHALCTHGSSKGLKSCDESFEAGGSYAVSIESLAKMLFSPHFDSYNRAYGKLLLMQFVTRALNTPVTFTRGESTAIYFSDEKGNFIFDGKSITRANSFNGARVISRSNSLVVLPNDNSDAYTADLYSKKPVPVTVLSEPLVTYNNTAIDKRLPILDLLVEDDFQASLFPHFLQVKSYQPLPLDWNGVQLFTAQELGVDLKNTIFVRDDKNIIYTFNFDYKSAWMVASTNVWPQQLNPKSVILFQGKRLALTAQGDVFVYTEKQTWEIYAPLAGRKITLMTRPFLWQVQLLDK